RRSQHALAPHINNMEHLLVSHGAYLDAGVAGGAGPCRFFTERKVEQRSWALLPRRKTGKHLVQLLTLIDQNRRWAERFPGIRGRTNILAAIAHDAAIGI